MAEPYVYVPTRWVNEIIECDEFGNVVYEKDGQGRIVYRRDSLGNLILDPVTNEPIPMPKLLQVGTRHSAGRDNNQEMGIVKSHERLDKHDNDILRLQIQQDLDGKAPGNAGSFSDTFDGEPSKIKRETAKAVLTESRAAGNTVLNVDSAEGFKQFQEVTIYDGTNMEDTLVTAVTDSTITVQALVNSYVKGAFVARSTGSIADGQMKIGNWGTYSIAVSEVI